MALLRNGAKSDEGHFEQQTTDLPNLPDTREFSMNTEELSSKPPEIDEVSMNTEEPISEPTDLGTADTGAENNVEAAAPNSIESNVESPKDSFEKIGSEESNAETNRANENRNKTNFIERPNIVFIVADDLVRQLFHQ